MPGGARGRAGSQAAPRLTLAEARVTAQAPAERRRTLLMLGSPAMRSHTDYLLLELKTRRGFVNITPEVERVVRESGVQEGLVLVNAMHITASVFINDDEAGLHHD